MAMLDFDPRDPFPSVSVDSANYAEAQRHSAAVDQWLGMKIDPIENTLRGTASGHATPQQLWIGLPAQSLLTPYSELRYMLSRLCPAPGTTVVDLGAGYGRLGFVLGRHYPGVRFLGYEIVEARILEGMRCLLPWNYSGMEIRCADLSDPDFKPFSAEYYFLYDYGTRVAVEKTLCDLRTIATREPITVVGRGRASRDAIERNHPWLSQVVSPRHFGHFSIYRSG